LPFEFLYYKKERNHNKFSNNYVNSFVKKGLKHLEQNGNNIIEVNKLHSPSTQQKELAFLKWEWVGHKTTFWSKKAKIT